MVTALLAVLASLLAAPAAANDPIHYHDEPSFAPQCHAASELDTSFKNMVADLAPPSPASGRWRCGDEGWVAHEPVAWLLFKREAWDGEERPRYFFTRIARFETISFAAMDADGTLRTLEWSEADGEPFAGGPVFRLELPEIKAETRALIVRIERPHSVPLLTEARLSFYPDDGDWSQLEVMILAFVLGMLVLPLFFDISFFIVLRERFVLLHAAMVVAMMGYVLSAGGLISVIDAIPLWVIAIAGPLLWAVGVGFSALFLAEFLENGAQSKLMRRMTLGTGYWSILVPGFFALQLPATHGFDDRLYFYAFIPVILIIAAAIAEAVARGSRSARFLAFAWTPIILAAIERLLRGIGAYVGPSTLDQGMFLATGLEVIVVSLAIADRFLALRRERDAALTEARTLGHLSERDALTGLLNRRGLEARFEALFKSGFDTFALIDLDRFKQVNDRYGHMVGDAALVACANALMAHQDPDLVAARLGGEEFVVLLRGKRTLQRAEALRQSIPMRIAADVEGLEIPVTASSGAIGVPRATSARMSFDEFYARADALMYDAKASGRNRMVSEKLTIFPTSTKPSVPIPKPVSRRNRRGRAARDKSKGRVA
ncbi:MAG: diguanylate cyclase [Pseudomonadota bacterium]